MAASSPQGQLSYADRARKAQVIRSPIEVPPRTGRPSASTKSPSSDQKPQAAVNVWDRRKEELAARSQSHEKIPFEPSEDDDDDDPFVVRSSRARPHVPVTAESPEDWPEVGKSPPPSTTDEPRTENGDNSSRKGGPPKWVPLQLQPPAEVQPQSRKDIKSNRQSANTSRPPSTHGQGRNSRNHSGRNSANHSRIHSNEGSAHSSPRNPKNRRLPADEPSPASNSNSNTNRSSRTGSPSHVQVQSDVPTYGAYLSPQQGPSPYYSQQPPVNPTVYQSPSHAPHPSLPTTDTPLPPMPPPPAHSYSYPYPNPYIPYDFIPPSAPYPYWDGHQSSHPGSGTHSPAYPPSITPSSYAAALPMHVQQHFYPPPSIQRQPSSYSHSSSRSSKVTLGSNSPGTTTSSVAMPAEQPVINGSTSVVFGSIESPSLPPETTILPSTGSVIDDSNVEKVFKTLAIGVDSSVVPKSRRSANKPVKEKEVVVNGEIAVDPAIVKEAEAGSSGDIKWKFGNEGLAHDDSSGEGVVESELPDASTNVEGSGSVVIGEGLGEDFRVKNFGYGFGIAAEKTISADVSKHDADALTQHPPPVPENDEQVPMTATAPTTTATNEHPSQPGPSNSRPRRGGTYNINSTGGYSGYDRGGGYVGERRRGGRGGGGMNGYGGRGGYNNRGYTGRGGGNHNHNHNHNTTSYNHNHAHNNQNIYQLRHQVPPLSVPPQAIAASFSVTPPPLFQGLPPSHHVPPSHVDSPYYPAPPPPPPPPHGSGHGGMATYIPTGYEPYPPAPLPAPLPLHTPSSSVQTPSPSSQSPQSQSQSSSTHGGHGHVAPPMPMPMSQLGFPLDSTRYYLLGQLEYYLSPQNMAQDLFLRRRMDSRGWIEISLLVSFNRVKQLTRDYQLVREVLMLSALVQVREGYVRMGGWESFVLPDAVKSVVEGGDGNDVEDQQQQGYSTSSSSYDLQSSFSVGESGSGMMSTGSVLGAVPSSQQQQQQQWNHQYSDSGSGVDAGEEEVDYAEEEEEEDDVVFVMGQNGGEGMWSHEKRAVR